MPNLITPSINLTHPGGLTVVTIPPPSANATRNRPGPLTYLYIFVPAILPSESKQVPEYLVPCSS